MLHPASLPGLSPLRSRLLRLRRQAIPSITATPAASTWPTTRLFSTTLPRREILDIAALPPRIQPRYRESTTSPLLSLHWPSPPRNVLIIPKFRAPQVTASTLEFAQHVHSEYPGANIVFERRIAAEVHESLPFPVYTADPTSFHDKIDIVATLGGDGTILRAASLFSLCASVPPMLSFSMGSLGFLGEWKFDEFKRAWRQVYMSGSRARGDVEDLQDPHTQAAAAAAAAVSNNSPPPPHPFNQTQSQQQEPPLLDAWSHVRGKSMGISRSAKVLLRNRLKVGVYDADGNDINSRLMPTSISEPQQNLPPAPEAQPPLQKKNRWRSNDPISPAFHAINELVIHRGPNPHLAIIDVFVNGRFLTEAVADGILVSTPTGSTAYSLSAGGSIMHPLVKALLITPICARSLSFRPLGLPLESSRVVLRLSEKNRGRELEVSIDGKRKAGVTVGMEIRVEGEMVGRGRDVCVDGECGGGGMDGGWVGGVPCVIRSPANHGPGAEDDDGWVGGLNGLLKFNYPFGEA
ncbi:ATP-NAD kinase-like domain-containing protein [Astrocystis sublimbata]|nr:ATP-NAD kinase-like domain-containing protein [Astrocystis sublimbata]